MAVSLLVIAMVVMRTTHAYNPTQCPCKEQWMCNVVTDDTKQVAVYATNLTNFNSFNLTKLTTVVVYEHDFLKYDSGWSILCNAHANGVKVLVAISINATQLQNREESLQIIEYYITFAKKHSLDGANIDIEFSTVNPKLRNAFTEFVKNSADAFHTEIPGSIIMTDVFWLPNIFHDTISLAKYSDYIFIMAYDEQENIFGKCTARANAPYYRTELGLEGFLALGVPANKLILGTPWYGYMYKCLHHDNDTCYISEKQGPLHCSQNLGYEIIFGDIMDEWAPHAIGGIRWDKLALSPYFTYKNASDPVHLYQVQYDDVGSLKLKYNLVDKWDIGGVGVWKADALNYTKGNKLTEEMWQALPCFQ